MNELTKLRSGRLQDLYMEQVDSRMALERRKGDLPLLPVDRLWTHRK